MHQLYEFVVYTISQSGNERLILMSKLAQFTDEFSFSLLIRVITSFFHVICPVFYKEPSPAAFAEMEFFARELDYLYS